MNDLHPRDVMRGVRYRKGMCETEHSPSGPIKSSEKGVMEHFRKRKRPHLYTMV